MASILVFSKDRPLQLHAYLESLLHFSDVNQNDISILYDYSQDIDYSKVIKTFPLVSWIKETNFYDDLLEQINNANEFIMFACDDVIFTGNFSIKKAEDLLRSNENIFGFSMRLGKNIKPLPKDISINENILIWNWKETSAPHYNYPWELDCTLYRKSDVLTMLHSTDEKPYRPNPFEGIFAADPKNFITRPLLACNEESCAIVITVNRVQDDACNPFDEQLVTDIYTLNEIYNKNDNTLDIEKISKMKIFEIHVDAEYFILRNEDKRFAIKNVYLKNFITKNGCMKRLVMFCKNLHYLTKYSIKEIFKNQER